MHIIQFIIYVMHATVTWLSESVSLSIYYQAIELLILIYIE